MLCLAVPQLSGLEGSVDDRVARVYPFVRDVSPRYFREGPGIGLCKPIDHQPLPSSNATRFDGWSARGNQMKTIRSLVVAIFVVAVATNSWGGSNLNLSKSNINRLQNNSIVITASANLGASESVLIYTAPANGDFMLTQFCASRMRPEASDSRRARWEASRRPRPQ